jgi:hypothetical protein
VAAGVNEATAVLHYDNYRPDPPRCALPDGAEDWQDPTAPASLIGGTQEPPLTKENRSGSA